MSAGHLVSCRVREGNLLCDSINLQLFVYARRFEGQHNSRCGLQENVRHLPDSNDQPICDMISIHQSKTTNLLNCDDLLLELEFFMSATVELVPIYNLIRLFQ